MNTTSQKNTPSGKDATSVPQRRSFLALASAGLSVVAAGLVSVPFVGFVFGKRERKVQWVDLGATTDFELNRTRLVTFDNPLRQSWDGVTSQTGVFVRYQGTGQDEEAQFLVLSVNCAHLGCPVSWFPQSELFLCPCHGGVYYADGSHASGPPPRGLFECVWRVQNGNLQIQAPHYPTLHDTLQQPV